MTTHRLDPAIRTLTAYNSLAHLRRHLRDGGKPPSFRSDKPAQAALGDALTGHGVAVSFWR